MKSQKEIELQELRKLPPDKIFAPRWYRPKKKGYPEKTYYQLKQAERG